jgi:hypothetical protein
MKTERLFNVVLLELSAEQLKLEDALEQALVSTMGDIGWKSTTIKDLVGKLATLEMTIAKFNDMISQNNNNEEKKEKQDGKI